MSATYSNLGFNFITNGTEDSTWGTLTNNNAGYIDVAISGSASIALVSATKTITLSDATASDSRSMLLTFTGSPGETCVVTVAPNNLKKLYFIQNDTDETVTIKQGTGGNVDIATTKSGVVHCDGAGAGAEVVDLQGLYVHPNHSGQVTSTADAATVLADSAITAQTDFTGTLASTDEVIFSDAGTLKKMDISIIEAYMQANMSALYTHPNHSGQVTSAADGATTVTVSAITGQTELTTGLASTDQLLVDDDGTLSYMDISVIEAYMLANLGFTVDSHPADTTTHGATGAVVGTTNTQTLSGKTLDDVVLTGSIDEQVYALSTGTVLNPANGTIQTVTLTAARTFTASLNAGEAMTLMLLNTTVYAVTWPSITWHGTGAAGTAPTLTGNDVIELWKVGTTIHGASAGGVG